MSCTCWNPWICAGSALDCNAWTSLQSPLEGIDTEHHGQTIKLIYSSQFNLNSNCLSQFMCRWDVSINHTRRQWNKLEHGPPRETKTSTTLRRALFFSLEKLFNRSQ